MFTSNSDVTTQLFILLTHCLTCPIQPLQPITTNTPVSLTNDDIYNSLATHSKLNPLAPTVAI